MAAVAHAVADGERTARERHRVVGTAEGQVFREALVEQHIVGVREHMNMPNFAFLHTNICRAEGTRGNLR